MARVAAVWEPKPIYWLHGKPLSGLPTTNKNRLKDDYTRVTRLVAERPWTLLAPFEALKATLKVNDNEETTRWVNFSDGESNEGHYKSESPFGVMELFEEKRSVTGRYGRSQLWIKSDFFGSAQQYPDRHFVTTEPLRVVHCDSIFFLEHLFGDSLLPKPGLSPLEAHCNPHTPEPKNLPIVGVVPVIEAQTGNIPGYPEEGENRALKCRCFTNDEMTWLVRCCGALQRFILEERSKFRPSDGVTLRTYPLHVHEGPECVTISYNMDIAYGGLWDLEVKCMWFD